MPTTQQVFETGKIGITKSRSVFDLSHSAKFTMVAGKLTPCLAYSDVLPGDTHKIDMSFVARSTTPVRPTMDDAYLQVEFWFVPNKSVLSRASMSPSLDDSNHSWKAVIGAQDNLLNMPLPGDNSLPGVYSSSAVSPLGSDASNVAARESWLKSLGMYLDYPLEYSTDYTSGTKFNPFAVLAYFAVWSCAYREPNLWDPVTYSISDGSIVFTGNWHAGINPNGNRLNVAKFGLADVCREHGYFGSALPWPQRNLNGVTLGLAGTAPVVGAYNDDDEPILHSSGADGFPYSFGTNTGVTSNSYYSLHGFSGSLSNQLSLRAVAEDAPGDDKVVNMSNLVTDLSKVSAVSINELRYAFALQGYYEALARMGNRYDDILAYYGVYSDVVDCDAPEYLGGKRLPLNITQVNNTAGTVSEAVGNLGAFSNTASADHYFTKSFKDFGTIIGVCFIRHHDTVYQRASKERTRMTALDYYNPAFARIGEVPVYKKELFIGFGAYDMDDDDDKATVNDSVFGYQEYGAEYRYHENCIRGRLVPSIGDLDYWTYASDWADGGKYDENNLISLGTFLDASQQVEDIDQTLVTSADSAGYQFVVDMYFNWTAVRNIPAHSIPVLLGGR